MSADPALVTAKISGGGAEPAHSVWTNVADRLQTATLGEFQIIRELGRGGMAAVFLAHDIHLDRKVAVKVMSPMLGSDARMVERFRREAKTGAGLKHPNIATVHRVLEGEGLYFFVMDFIRGRPLDAILQRNGALTIEVTRALLYQIGSGLAYAHRRKIYHRDVKPANVLVSAADGTAVVTDFGIAKVAESPNQTQTGAVIGTPAYMAPEQILGREITAAVDQYALGIMAHEMLIGSPPFVGTSYVVMHAHTELTPPSIRAVRPDCPVDFDAAIARMLAKDPADRWPSVPHALAALGAAMIAEDDPIREEIVRLATPDDAESARYATNTPLSPAPTATRAANVALVAISPPPEVIEAGDSFRLVASPRDSRGEEVTSVPVDWSSANVDVLSVQTDGTIIARKPGTTEVSATAGRARGAVLLTVEPARVSSLQMSIPPGVIAAGDRVQLSARAVDKRQNTLPYLVRWSVGDSNVARISADGVLEGRAEGVVDVYAESNGVRVAGRVNIAPPPVASVRVSSPPSKVVAGSTIRLVATALDARGHRLDGRTIEWSTSDADIASVSGDGTVVTHDAGSVKITVSCEGKSASVAMTIRAGTISEPRAPKVGVVPAPAIPSGFSATALVAPSRPTASPRQPPSTPVLAPAVPDPEQEPARAGKQIALFAVTGAVLVAMVLIAVLTRPGQPPRPDSAVAILTAVPKPDTSSAVIRTAAAPETTTRSVPASKTTEKKPPPPRIDQTSRGAPPGKATSVGTGTPEHRRAEPDVFQITILSAPPPMHVGDRFPLRANVERTSGSAPMPRIVWASTRPTVVDVDPVTGAATAIGDGQAVLVATGGGARAEVTVTVAAPVVVAPPPQRTTRQTADSQPRGASPEELRTKAIDALQGSANAMVTAIKTKDIATATRLFADGRNNDSQDLLKLLPDLFKPAISSQIGQSQIGDRAGTLEYQVKIEWETTVGAVHGRLVTLRAEAERSGDAWTVARHRVLRVQNTR